MVAQQSGVMGQAKKVAACMSSKQWTRAHGWLATVPQSFLTLPTIRPSRYNYNLAAYDARTIANCRRNSMLINKRRFSMCCSSDPSGDGFDERERGESLLCGCIISPSWFSPTLLDSEVGMVPVKPLETVHTLLRWHFERVSKLKAQQFAELRDVLKDVRPGARSSDGVGDK
jgi:hypothetical protein